MDLLAAGSEGMWLELDVPDCLAPAPGADKPAVHVSAKVFDLHGDMHTLAKAISMRSALEEDVVEDQTVTSKSSMSCSPQALCPAVQRDKNCTVALLVSPGKWYRSN
jgi:hypothetical protein